MKKVLSAIMAAAVLCATVAPLTACTPTVDEGEPINPDKTQLYIANYYGGLGDDWLKELKRQYEEIHEDIQIIIRNDKTSYLPDQLVNTIKTDTNQLYFVEKQHYHDLVKDKKLADITDVVTEKLTKYGEDVSIEEKIADDSLKEYFGGELVGNRYYALPTYMAHFGIVYDVDLWEDSRRGGFYIGEGGTASNLKLNTGASKSVGPDGIAGTRDDGMPATYEEFTALIGAIRKKNVTPFIWSGKIIDYQQSIATAWWCDYEGYDDFKLNYTFNGDYNGKTITQANAYELQKQEGKQYALKFVNDLVSHSDWYTASSGGATKDHLGAQNEYVSSYPKGQPIAMMLEADWWENEARDNNDFSDMVQRYGSQWAYGTRRFGFMPIPKTEGSADGETVLSTSATCCFFVNANAGSKMELAKDFLQFCHTDSALQIFNTYTGVCRPYRYSLSPEQRENLTYFSKQLDIMYNGDEDNEPIKVVHDVPLCNLRAQNKTYFMDWDWNTGTYNNPFTAFVGSNKPTPATYFQGLYTYQSQNWSRFGL